MTKDQWKKLITQQTKSLNTYQKEFDSVIETLADILEQRDAAYQEYIDNGAEAVTEFRSDRGAVNLKKNPRLQVWMDLNTQALAFWRDMGLTTAGLKKIGEAVKKEQRGSALEAALQKLGGS